MINTINKEIIQYVETKILPQYDYFDKGHDRNHVTKVINSSLAIAKDYTVDMDMVYVIAAYSDSKLKQSM